jgi:hypothetical protein
VSDADDGFLSRWAKRKARVRSGLAEPADASTIAPAATRGAAAAPGVPAPTEPTLAASPARVAPSPAESTPRPEPEPPPTMDDVARLTRASDYSRFVGSGVDPGVSNAAMKKLFSDPHFNVMDGLDTYIDDYGKPDPIPPSMLRKMTQSAMLGLFDDEAAPATPPAGPVDRPPPGAESPDGRGPPEVAQSQSGPSSDPAPAGLSR